MHGSSPAWLSIHRTFRWNDGVDVERYRGVETTSEGLEWFAWSHAPGDGGRTLEARQSFASFRADGPARPAPSAVLSALARWIDEHATER